MRIYPEHLTQELHSDGVQDAQVVPRPVPKNAPETIF